MSARPPEEPRRTTSRRRTRPRRSSGCAVTCGSVTTRPCWLRLTKHASAGAVSSPVFVWEPRERRSWAPGGAARWWLWHSLSSLETDLRRLRIAAGRRTGRPRGRRRRTGGGDRGRRGRVGERSASPTSSPTIERSRPLLNGRGVDARVVPQANLLADPLSVRTRDGRPYTVFTPFWRARLAGPAPEAPLPAPKALPAAARHPRPASRSRSSRPRPSGPGRLGSTQSGRRASAARTRVSACSSKVRSATTPWTATGPTSKVARASRRTCAGAR